MTDTQRIVDDIRAFCQGSDQTMREALRPLAASYAAACKDVSDRLRRCDEFLRQGLRSEAIRYAEAEPALLDVLAQLDFPERSTWAQLAALYGLPAAPELRIDVAEALNRAYGEEQPLQHLLRAHRRLALARATVGERLAVLRQIAVLDRGNPVWEDDLMTFEAVRLGQVEGEARQAFGKKDFKTLNNIWTELRAHGWLKPPPPELITTVDQLLQAGNVDWTLQRLAELAGRLEMAFQLLDLPTACRIAEEWRGLVRTIPLPAASALPRRVAPVLQWVAQQEAVQRKEAAFQAAAEEFERAVREPAVDEEGLAQCYNVLRQRGGGKVAKHLKEAYEQRLGFLGQRQSRRERIILAVTFAVGAIFLVGFLLFVTLRH